MTTLGFHHWRHARAGERRDCDSASMFPWLDRIFGTHQPRTRKLMESMSRRPILSPVNSLRRSRAEVAVVSGR
jgi:hypothetical protein